MNPFTPEQIRIILQENNITPSDTTVGEILAAINDYIETSPESSYIPAGAKRPLKDLIQIYRGKTFEKFQNALRQAIDSPTLYDLVWNTGSYKKTHTAMQRLLNDLRDINFNITFLLRNPNHRPQEKRMFAFVAELAGIYQACTGKKLSRPYSKVKKSEGQYIPGGPFYAFISSFMKILDINISDTTIASVIDRVWNTLNKKPLIGLPSREIIISRMPTRKHGKNPL